MEWNTRKTFVGNLWMSKILVQMSQVQKHFSGKIPVVHNVTNDINLLDNQLLFMSKHVYIM